MRQVSVEEGVDLALTALLADRLALLAGAGLSMASPSTLPSAATLAAKAKRKYDATYGASRPPLVEGLEHQAQFFFERGELYTVYLRALIDRDSFAGPPNLGHSAAADLLLIQAIQTAVTTNVDALIEAAGMMLLGQVGAGIEVNVVAALPPDRAPVLKLHGCWLANPDSTIWAQGQLEVEPFASRIAESANWLTNRLLDRDLLIVGYWTDWDYLNVLLERTLGHVRPARVLVVDPCDHAAFQAKAPALYGVGQRAGASFLHVRESGHTFLDRLRLAFSHSFVRRTLHSGLEVFEHTVGRPPDPAWLEPPPLDNESYWRMRRDLEGCGRNEPARTRVPPQEAMLGLTLLQLRAKGATADGPFWKWGGRLIRVLRTPNQALHVVQADHDGEFPPATAPDISIAVGAESQAVAAHIVRSGTTATIARGSAGRWLTRADAEAELEL